MILVDTNVLVRYAKTADPAYKVIDTAVDTLHGRGEILAVVPQNLYEFRAVATRPILANGLGLQVADARALVRRLLFHFLPDLPALFPTWESLVVRHECHGRVSFDARLVAAMMTHGIGRILTLDPGDFARFPGIAVIDPYSVVAAP